MVSEIFYKNVPEAPDPSPGFRNRGGQKSQGGGTFLNRMLDVCSNRYENSRLQHVNFNCILLDTESYSDMKAEPAEHCHLLLQLGQGKRQ